MNESSYSNFFELTNGNTTVSFIMSNGRWTESRVVDGEPLDNFGGKTYQSYLTPEDIAEWMSKDYPGKWVVVDADDSDEDEDEYWIVVDDETGEELYGSYDRDTAESWQSDHDSISTKTTLKVK